MADKKDSLRSGLEPVDIAAATLVDTAMVFGVSSEIASHQKQELLHQGIDAGAKARRGFLETHRSPPVGSVEYGSWLARMNETVESARKSFVEKGRRLGEPLTQPIEVFRNATKAQKAAMIGAIVGTGIIVAAFVRKIRKDWSHEKSTPTDMDFEAKRSSDSNRAVEPSWPQEYPTNSIGHSFADRVTEARRVESDRTKAR